MADEKKVALFQEKDIVISNIKAYLKRVDIENPTFEEKQNYIRAFVKNISILLGYYDGHLHLPNVHQVIIEFKLDSLTDFKLSRNIKVGYKKNGHRTGIINEEILITHHLISAQKEIGFVSEMTKNNQA